ncbi:hypothetical protein JOE48_002841 [Methylobacterium sp. PvR107]|nr:hypothetical protein [Methylobacterium sp. PvR107]
MLRSVFNASLPAKAGRTLAYRVGMMFQER